MMEEIYHATTQNWFYPDMSNVLVNKKILQWRQDLPSHLRQIDLKEKRWTGIPEIHLDQDSDKWRTPVNTMRNLRVPEGSS